MDVTKQQPRFGWHNFEQFPRHCFWLALLSVGLVGAIAFLWGLGSIGLVDETEPLFAEAARQMTVTGDWITPYFNGETRFDKPPLVYWLMALGYLIGGVNEWMARLPSAGAAIALMGFLFVTLQRFGWSTPGRAHPESADSPQGKRQRWLAASIGAAALALNPQMIAWGRTAVSDMLLCGCMGGALLCFFWGYATSAADPPGQAQGQTAAGAAHDAIAAPHPGFWPRRWYLACYVLLALAVLTKGPVGIILPGLIILTFLLYVGQLRSVWQEARTWVGLGICALLSVPWFVLVILANGQAYIDSFFGYHNVERFTQVVNHHSAPIYFYVLVVLVGFLPWSVAVPFGLIRLRVWRRSFWQQQPRSAQLGLFALVWFGVIFVFFTIAVTKLPSYTIPLLPAAAILVALVWSDELTRRPSPHWRWGWNHATGIGITGGATLVLFLLLAGLMVIAPSLIGPETAAPDLQTALAATSLTERGAIIWGLAAIAIAILLGRRGWWRWCSVTQGLAFLLCFLWVLYPTLFFMDRQRQEPLRVLSHLVVDVQRDREELVMVGFKKPSVTFYTQRPVHYESHPNYLVRYMANHSRTTPQASTFLVIGHPPLFEELNLAPEDYEILEKRYYYVLARVKRQPVIEQYARYRPQVQRPTAS